MKKLLVLSLAILMIMCSFASCDWFTKNTNHEHTWEYAQYETGHFKQYTCGCPSPDIMGEHYDNDGDLHCDVCGYDMSERPTPTNYFLRNQTGYEWLNEITSEDVAEIKIISQEGMVAPGCFKYISSSTNEATISRLFEDYYWLDTWPVAEEDTVVCDGGLVTVQFVLKNGTLKELKFNNGEFYEDLNGNHFKLLYLPTFNDVPEYISYYVFETDTGMGEIWYEDDTTEPYFLCEIPMDELEFTYIEFELPDEVSEYPYFIKTEFGTLGFYSNDIFFIVGEGQYYQLVGKNLDELVAEYYELAEK